MKTTSERRSQLRQFLEASVSFGISRRAALDLLADAERAEVLERALREMVIVLESLGSLKAVEDAKAALGETP